MRWTKKYFYKKKCFIDTLQRIRSLDRFRSFSIEFHDLSRYRFDTVGINFRKDTRYTGEIFFNENRTTGVWVSMTYWSRFSISSNITGNYSHAISLLYLVWQWKFTIKFRNRLCIAIYSIRKIVGVALKWNIIC